METKRKLNKIVLFFISLEFILLLVVTPGIAQQSYQNFYPLSLFNLSNNYNFYSPILDFNFNSMFTNLTCMFNQPSIFSYNLNYDFPNYNSNKLGNYSYINSFDYYAPLNPFITSSLLNYNPINFLTSPIGSGGNLYPQVNLIPSLPTNSWSKAQSSKIKIDDWEYSANQSSGASYYGGGSYGGSYGAYGGYSASSAYSYSSSSSNSSSTNIGYSTGGAKDINNFRANIENDYLPINTDITYEGLFYDYYFDTGQQEECQELFCSSYSLAVTQDPLSGEEEYYVSVGLNSGISESDFQRKKLNLVIVLDISGSMGSSFNKYYYDRFGNQQVIADTEDNGKTKMKIAAESVVGLLDHLNADDRFGMVLFESNAHLAKPLRLVGETDMEAIKDHILELVDTGGTNMSAGMSAGTELFNEYLNIDYSIYENRIIFITDAMPNIGTTSDTGLLGMTKNNADNKIYSTFIGVGVDFNTELVEYITKIRGANYYSVHSSIQFKERMDDQFEYMVTPLVFNLELNMAATGYEIKKVYGSPEANEATGQLMKVNTLFPSENTEEGTKGGTIILKLKKLSDNAEIILIVSYEDRLENTHNNIEIIQFGDQGPEYFANTGIRKGILLSRYANLMKNWIIDERTSLANSAPVNPSITCDCGIIIPCSAGLGQWERQSVDLRVSEPYSQLFSEFKDYFVAEMNDIGDNTLDQEVTILEKLIAQ